MIPYPIVINTSDTGSLGDYLGNFASQQPAVRLGAGAAAGAVLAILLKKKPLLGAILGAAGGYLAAGYNKSA